MQITKWIFRTVLFSVFTFFLWTLLSGLSERFDLDRQAADRLSFLQIKKKRLCSLAQKKATYLGKKAALSDQGFIDVLMNMPLCRATYEALVQSACHPFSKGVDQLGPFIDRLYTNHMEFQKRGKKFSLVHPVYMETKDLEKMAGIIENGGAFAPLEITHMKLMRKEVLGGELWELSELVCESVDGDGALLPSS